MPKRAAKRKSLSRVSAKTSAVTATASVDPTIKNLKKIDHIVVLMLENRSFDHMLGYLSLHAQRTDIDGLTPTTPPNVYNGQAYSPEPLPNTAGILDPCHSSSCVARQLSNNNGGFVEDYAQIWPTDPGVVMDYYDGQQLPTYDLLAKEFVVCDRWFCSVPGATWPNRLYAACGRAPSKDNKGTPLYDIPSFVRHLDARNISWKWYSQEKFARVPISTLQALDARYRLTRNSVRFDPHFFRAASSGNLPSVAWIDPNFVDYGGPEGANDDHPPADVRAGQSLVQEVVQAVSNGPKWNKTLLIITYDEHGGFFDHVAPPAAQDDNPVFRQFGVRVPAIVVSPWVQRGVGDPTLFDHTSITKTILLRFCQNASGAIPNMGLRVGSAAHLGGLLVNAEPRSPVTVPALASVAQPLNVWRAESHQLFLNIATSPRPRPLTEFQEGWLKVVDTIEKQQAAGVKPAKPKRTT